MSSYNQISGVVYCHKEVSEDLTKVFIDVPTENEYWHRNSGEDYLFSLSVKESRIQLVLDALARLAQIKSMDPVDGEWFYVDGVVTFQYESKDSIAHVKIVSGETSQLISLGKQFAAGNKEK